MDFMTLLRDDFEDLLDHKIIIVLINGNEIICRTTEFLRTEIVVHDDFLIVKHMKMGEDNVLYPTTTYYIPISMIVEISTTWED